MTLATLADLVRGLGGGSFVIAEGKGKKRAAGAEKGTLRVEEVAGGKVDLNKDVRAIYSREVEADG